MPKSLMTICLLLACTGCEKEQTQPASSPEAAATSPDHATQPSVTDIGAQPPLHEYRGHRVLVYTSQTAIRQGGGPSRPGFATLIDGQVVYDGRLESIGDDGTVEIHSLPPGVIARVRSELVRRVKLVGEGGG